MWWQGRVWHFFRRISWLTVFHPLHRRTLVAPLRGCPFQFGCYPPIRFAAATPSGLRCLCGDKWMRPSMAYLSPNPSIEEGTSPEPDHLWSTGTSVPLAQCPLSYRPYYRGTPSSLGNHFIQLFVEFLRTSGQVQSHGPHCSWLCPSVSSVVLRYVAPSMLPYFF